MPDAFLIRAALAGIAVALAAGPLGCFVVWRRMAYFGEAVSHAAILGVALSLALSVPVAAGTLVAGLAMGLAVLGLSGRGLAMDTTLGVLAHSTLALGLVAVAFLPGIRVDLTAYLFGDILAVGWREVGAIGAGAAAVLALLAWRWSALLTATLDEGLAAAAGIRPGRERLVLTLALAGVVAVAIKVIGALLIVAMLLVPAAAARGLSRTPEAMAAGAAVAGAVAVLGGLAGSLAFDTPAGPSIVSAAAGLFAVSLPAGRLVRSVGRPRDTGAR